MTQRLLLAAPQRLSGCEKSLNTKLGAAQCAAAASSTPMAAAAAVASSSGLPAGSQAATAVEATAAATPAERALSSACSAPLQAGQSSVWLCRRSSSTRLEGSAGGRLPLPPAQGMPLVPPAREPGVGGGLGESSAHAGCQLQLAGSKHCRVHSTGGPGGLIFPNRARDAQSIMPSARCSTCQLQPAAQRQHRPVCTRGHEAGAPAVAGLQAGRGRADRLLKRKRSTWLTRP